MASRCPGAVRSGLLALAALVVLSGCGDEAGENGGSLPGGGASLLATGVLPFAASQGTVLAGTATCASSGVEVSYAELVASDLPGLCGTWQGGAVPANSRTIEVLVIDPRSDGGVVTVGTYAVSLDPAAPGLHALLAVRQTDGSCEVSALEASAGSVEVTSASAERLAGTVVALLSGGGQVSGAFDAASCAVSTAADLCTGEVEPVTSSCAP